MFVVCLERHVVDARVHEVLHRRHHHLHHVLLHGGRRHRRRRHHRYGAQHM